MTTTDRNSQIISGDLVPLSAPVLTRAAHAERKASNMVFEVRSLAIGAVVGGISVAFMRALMRRKPPSGQIWASPITTCSRRVIAACAEAGIEWSFVPIHLAKGEHKSKQMIALQPYGKVPAWIDADGFTLYESRAIMRHVCEGSGLVPAGAQALALMDQWVSVDYSAFYPAFIPIYHMHVTKKMPFDEAACKAKAAELRTTLDLMEARLAESAYLAGSAFSLADLTYMCYFEGFGACGLADDLASRPALARWWETIRGRPAWQYTLSKKYIDERALPVDPLGRTKPWEL